MIAYWAASYEPAARANRSGSSEEEEQGHDDGDGRAGDVLGSNVLSQGDDTETVEPVSKRPDVCEQDHNPQNSHNNDLLRAERHDAPLPQT